MMSEQNDIKTTGNSEDNNNNNGGVYPNFNDVSNNSNSTGNNSRQSVSVNTTNWVPDADVTHCMACHKQFNFIIRKHHCRCCGKVFCDSCSTLKLPLPHLEIYGLERVCKQCFDQHSPSKDPTISPFNAFSGNPINVGPFARALVICNPNSGGKRGLIALSELVSKLRAAGIESVVVMTEYPGHAKEIVKTGDLKDIVCAIGGDGTMHEVANGMLSREDKKKVPIAIIPAGSGNTFAYDMGISNIDRACKAIAAGVARNIDVLEFSRVTNKNENDEFALPQIEKLYSVNIVGWGLPSNNLKVANKMRVLGKANYNLAATTQIVSREAHQAKVTLQDGRVIEGTFIMIQGQLNIHMGNLTPFCPRAKVDDGLIDLILIKQGPIVDIMSMFLKSETAHHLSFKEVEYYQTQSYTLEPTGSTLQGEGSTNVDGELVGWAPFKVTCLPKSLTVLTGY